MGSFYDILYMISTSYDGC